MANAGAKPVEQIIHRCCGCGKYSGHEECENCRRKRQRQEREAKEGRRAERLARLAERRSERRSILPPDPPPEKRSSEEKEKERKHNKPFYPRGQNAPPHCRWPIGVETRRSLHLIGHHLINDELVAQRTTNLSVTIRLFIETQARGLFEPQMTTTEARVAFRNALQTFMEIVQNEFTTFAIRARYRRKRQKQDAETRIACKKLERMTALAQLGLRDDATKEEIDKAYRAAALKLHPDRVPEPQREAASEKMVELNVLYAFCKEGMNNE